MSDIRSSQIVKAPLKSTRNSYPGRGVISFTQLRMTKFLSHILGLMSGMAAHDNFYVLFSYTIPSFSDAHATWLAASHVALARSLPLTCHFAFFSVSFLAEFRAKERLHESVTNHEYCKTSTQVLITQKVQQYLPYHHFMGSSPTPLPRLPPTHQEVRLVTSVVISAT